MSKFIAYLKRPEWSPYVAGAGLGFVTIIALVLSNALLAALARAHQQAREVHVQRLVAVRMLEVDQVAGAALASGKHHTARADGLHRRADRRTVINAQVRAVHFEDGMVAAAAAVRSDRRGKLQRRAQK